MEYHTIIIQEMVTLKNHIENNISAKSKRRLKSSLKVFTRNCGSQTPVSAVIVCNGMRVSCKKDSNSGFIGQCVDLPAAISQGDTMEELETNMKGIELVLESYQEQTSMTKKAHITGPQDQDI